MLAFIPPINNQPINQKGKTKQKKKKKMEVSNSKSIGYYMTLMEG